MNILVCVKQVPDTTAVKIDPVTNTLIRAGVPSILNPFDGFALEMALQMKDKTGGTVTVMSMGPAQAEDVLRESLSVGADEAYQGRVDGDAEARGNDSNLLIVFYVQIMRDDFVMQLHRF